MKIKVEQVVKAVGEIREKGGKARASTIAEACVGTTNSKMVREAMRPVDRALQRSVDRALQAARKQGLIRYDSQKGWLPCKV
jgi:hypothetical protein